MMFACNTNSIFCASLNVFLLAFPSREEWIPPELNGDQILCPWLSTSRTMVVLCVFYRALMRAKMKQIWSFFFSLVFLFRVSNPSYNKAFSLSIFLHFRAHKSALNAHLTRDLIRVLYIKRENTSGTLYLVRKSERERVKTASFKVVLYSHI